MSQKVRAAGDQGNQNTIGQFNSGVRIGSALELLKRFFTGAAATNVMVLPVGAKAATIVSAYATAGTVTGEFTPVLGGAPATTEVSINAAGDIVFQATDAVTAAEVNYTIHEGQTFTETIPVAGSTGTPLANKSAVFLVSAEVTVGVSTGAVTVDFRGVVPATGEAAIGDLGTDIEFNAAQVVAGSARVTYIAAPGVGVALDSVGDRLDADVNY